MAGCALTAGMSLPCKDYVGGVRKVYLGHLSDFDSGVTVASNVVTVLPTATIYEFEVKPQTASWIEAPTGDSAAHTVSFVQTLEFQVPALAKTLGVATELIAMEAIVRGRWVAFVEDSNGNRLMMGRLDGAEANAGEWTTGVAKIDFNGYKLTLTADERFPAEHVAADTATPFDNVGGTITIPPNP